MYTNSLFYSPTDAECGTTLVSLVTFATLAAQGTVITHALVQVVSVLILAAVRVFAIALVTGMAALALVLATIAL